MKHSLIFVLFTCFFSFFAGATTPLQNYRDSRVASVKFAQQDWDLSYPIWNMKNTEKLELAFDLLGDESSSLAYKIIHCEADWTPSDISPLEYLSSLQNDFYLDDYELSFNTQTLYTHYTIALPNDDIKFKISGNYIIQIYNPSAPEKVLLQQRFLISENEANIEGKIIKSNGEQHSKGSQRIHFQVNCEDKQLPQTRNCLKAVVLQNFRWGNAQTLRPLFMNGTHFRFEYANAQGRFCGNYEFPYFDISDKLRSTHSVHTLEEDDDGFMHYYLYPSEAPPADYFYLKDMNGNFAIAAQNTFNATLEADYAWVHFTYKNPNFSGKAYVLGRFNDWQPLPDYQLVYDKDLQLYHAALFLKQGIYNYTFATQDSEGNTQNLMGNYDETENDYYIFVYYTDPRLQTERLVGWKRLNSITDTGN